MPSADHVRDLRQPAARERLAHEVLERLNDTASTDDLVQVIARMVQEAGDFEAVGVRLRDGDDFPYYEASGFSDAFLRTESSLCACDGEGNVVRDASGNAVLECLCGDVLCGRTDPARPFF